LKDTGQKLSMQISKLSKINKKIMNILRNIYKNKYISVNIILNLIIKYHNITNEKKIYSRYKQIINVGCFCKSSDPLVISQDNFKNVDAEKFKKQISKIKICHFARTVKISKKLQHATSSI
jgi:hypothetical protein